MTNPGGIAAYLVTETTLYRAELEWYWILLFGIISIPLGSFMWDLVRGKRPQDDVLVWMKSKRLWKRPKRKDAKKDGPNNPISLDELTIGLLQTMRDRNKKKP